MGEAEQITRWEASNHSTGLLGTRITVRSLSACLHLILTTRSSLPLRFRAVGHPCRLFSVEGFHSSAPGILAHLHYFLVDV